MDIEMALLVADCPRCSANNTTFDVWNVLRIDPKYDPQNSFEAFCVYPVCKRSTVFIISTEYSDPPVQFKMPSGIMDHDGALNEFFTVKRFISPRDHITPKPPEYLPKELENVFAEGAACLSIGCNNAAATMFRLCIDLATRPLLPDPADTAETQPNSRTRRDLGPRLAWMFDNGILPLDLRELAQCIREDGNDGAHVGNLTKKDAEDLLDFTDMLLKRLITEPERLRLAEERRKARRTP